MSKSLEGRVFAVTGAAGNLGAATASLLLERGARVLLLDRSAARPKQTFEAALARGQASLAELDLMDDAATREVVERERDRAGRFDGVVCTVGGYAARSVLDSGWADFEAMITVNLRSTVATTRAVLPALLAAKAGAIVHVASLAGLSGSAEHAAYSAAKAAVLRFTESTAAEVKSSGVRVNAVLPGTLDTPQNRSWMSDAAKASAIPLGDVAEVIGFLLSDAAASVTGVGLPVTGRQ